MLGILGSNGTGKSTACRILAGELKPNLGNYQDPPSWQNITKYYRGSDLQNYFTKMLNDELTVSMKPQMDSDSARGLLAGRKLKELVEAKAAGVNAGRVEEIMREMELTHLVVGRSLQLL